jgi:dienelactone hydrolase
VSVRGGVRAAGVGLAGLLLLGACTGGGEPASDGPSAAAAGGPSPSSRPAEAPPCLPDGTTAAAIGPEDDPTLVAWRGSGTRAVVLAPQNQGGPCQWADQLTRLSDAGYLVASFSWGSDSAASLLGAVAVLRSVGAEQVALVGASKGGTYVAALADEVDAVAVVALGPPADFDGVDARAETSTYDGPLLVVASTNDGDVAVGSSRWVSRLDDPTTFLELPGGAHGVELFATAHRDQVQAAVDGVLAQGFGG